MSAARRERDEPPRPMSIGTIDVDGRRFTVSLHTAHDGVEYVGRLWFTDESWEEDSGFPDRGALPGRTISEVLAMATRLRPEDLVKRYYRATAEKRRYHRLRRATEDILVKVRYMNQVAVSMRAGLLDTEGAAQEIELTERQLHELIGTLRHHAGVEALEPGMEQEEPEA
jgi:hypothetical protein